MRRYIKERKTLKMNPGISFVTAIADRARKVTLFTSAGVRLS
tara:strand:+ start:69 stop:194 length:126 start_codon:yes stop_codon:yes gene_type:complete